MKKIILISSIVLALTACKKEEKPVEQKQPVVQKTIPVDTLVSQSLSNPEDWSKDVEIYIDDVLTCANSIPGQTKYVFRADAFENPPVALILLKNQADKVYACTIEGNSQTPNYKEIKVSVPPKSPRFYPGELPKADSCLTNTRVLDKTGHTAGWLSKITCG